MPLPRIAVVGSINTDIIVRAGRLPAPGETVLGSEWIMAGGGKGANQAVAAARAGAEVHLVGRVGADLFGRDSIARLKAAGINVAHVIEDTQHTSGLAAIIVGPDGDNIIAVAQCANGAVSPADVDAAARVIAAAHVLVVQMETPPETVYHAICTAHRSGTRVLLNPAPAPREPIPPEILAMIDYLVPNEAEAMRIAGTDVPDTGISSLLRHGVKHVIVTLGSEGAAIFARAGAQGCGAGLSAVASAKADRPRPAENTAHASTPQPHQDAQPNITRTDLPAYNVNAVDAVGAGDAFCGVLACAVAEGLDLPAAVQLANAAAAISVTRHGAQPSLPTRAEITTFIETH